LFPTIASDNNATFSVQVAKIGSVATSRSARVSVVADVTPPRVIQVFTSYTNLNTLLVHFNEPLDPATGDTFNFDIPGFSTTGWAPLIDSGETSTVTLDNPLTAGVTYHMDVSFWADLSGNTINLTNVTFTAGSDLPPLA